MVEVYLVKLESILVNLDYIKNNLENNRKSNDVNELCTYMKN